jgi:hypothetical protein
MLRSVVTHQTNGVAFGVLDERHPFIRAGGSKAVIGVAEDERRLRDDFYAVTTQRFDRHAYVVDLEVDEGTRRTLLEKQPYLT